jgi:hypothetical protein
LVRPLKKHGPEFRIYLAINLTRWVRRLSKFHNYLYKFNLFLGFYRPRKLGLSFPRLYDIPEGEAMASALLQVRFYNSK